MVVRVDQSQTPGESVSPGWRAGFSPEALRAAHERAINPASGKSYSMQAVSNLLARRDIRLGRTQVWNLITGRSMPQDPAVVLAFAELFNVPPTEFFPGISAERAAEWDRAATFRRHRVSQVALRELTGPVPEHRRDEVARTIQNVLDAAMDWTGEGDGDRSPS
jgi:hypothetical protein